MKGLYPRSLLRIIAAALFTLALAGTASAAEGKSRDVLWDIVSNCVDPAAADYCTKCRWPRPETACAADMICKQTTDVWAETEAYVALRDPKMCGCPKDFVHGLVMPRARVTGVEDPKHPDGIWGFAWATAKKTIGEDPAAALAVNPPGKRAQDQLHLHIVRLQEDARRRFSPSHLGRVRSLDEVWKTAAKTAAAVGLTDYGILVTTDPEGGFLVLIDKDSPEKKYVVERCRKEEERKK